MFSIKISFAKLINSLLLFLILFTIAQAQNLPAKSKILEQMQLANKYFMEKWPDPTADLVMDKVRPSNIWTRATYFEGLMALYSIDPKPAYYDFAVKWGESHEWGMAYGDRKIRDADNQCCGQTYIELYQIDPKQERIAKIKAVIDTIVAHEQNNDWSWIDAVQMGMPIYAKLGVIFKDSKYFEKMFAMYHFSKTTHGDSGLYNQVDRLWWRDATFDPPYTEPNGEDCYWSRGNGWVFMALARVLDVLPENEPHRGEYVKTFREMADALPAVQRPDGFWNVSLHDSTHFGGRELSGTAMFAYGLAWGVNHGLLKDKKYEVAFIKAWNGMTHDALHPNGFLGYVQGTGKEPASSQPVSYSNVPNFEDYSLGAFLQAGVEVYKFVKK